MKTRTTVFAALTALVMGGLLLVDTPAASTPTATVNAVDYDRTYSEGDRVYLTGSGFAPGDRIVAAGLVPIREDRTTYPNDFWVSYDAVSVDAGGNLSGYIDLPAIPVDVKWVEVSLFAEKSNVRGGEWLAVQGTAAPRIAKTAAAGDVVIDDNNGDPVDGVAQNSERIDFQPTSTGWTGSTVELVRQYEYTDESGDTENRWVNLTEFNAEISGGTLQGHATTSSEYALNTKSIRLRVYNDDFESSFSNPMPTPSIGPASTLLVQLPGQTFESGTGVTGTPSTLTAGTSYNLVLHVVDDNNNRVPETGNRDITFTTTAGNSPNSSAPTVDGETFGSAGTTINDISFTNGKSANVPFTLFKAEIGVTITAEETSTLTGEESSSITVNFGALHNFGVVLTSPQERNMPFTGTNTVTARDGCHNPITNFNAANTNVTMSISVGDGDVEVASRGNGVLNLSDDFVNGVANLTTIGFKVTSGSADTKTIEASGGTKTGSTTVTINITPPAVSTPSPEYDTQISTGAASPTFSAGLDVTNTGGTYKLYWLKGETTEETSASISNETLIATLTSGQLSALTGQDYLYWWFGGTDGAGNELTGTPISTDRSRLILDPTVTFTGEQLATGMEPDAATPLISIHATGEMSGMDVTVTRIQFAKSGNATTAHINSLSLYHDKNKDNAVDGGDVLLQTITIDNDTKLNGPNFNNFSEPVHITNDGTEQFLLVVNVNESATSAQNIGYRINASSDVSLGQTVANVGGDFPVPDGVIDATLPIELASFTAQSTPSGVSIEWVTESEIENAGFYVLRSLNPDGPFERQSDFIPGRGTTAHRSEYRFTDRDLLPGATVHYVLEQHDFDGTVTREGTVLSVTMSAPTAFKLHPTAPNPFNPSTSVVFEVPHTADVSIGVYDVTGRFVRNLAAQSMPAGVHRVLWDGRDANGREVASGTYIIRMAADGGEFQQLQRATLLR